MIKFGGGEENPSNFRLKCRIYSKIIGYLEGCLTPMSETDSRGGLYLVIVGKSRTWMFRYKRRGKGHWMGLGPDSLVSLATARDAAIDARRLLRQGVEAGLVVQNSGAERLAVCGMPSTGVSNPTARGQTASMEQAVAGGHPTARGQRG